MTDDGAVLLAHLAGLPQVAALVGDRIWLEVDYPPAQWQGQPIGPSVGPCLVVKRRGGRSVSPLLGSSYQFKCYGGTPYDANALYRALVNDLDGGRGGQMRWAYLEGPGFTMVEPSIGWPFVACYFQCFFANA